MLGGMSSGNQSHRDLNLCYHSQSPGGKYVIKGIPAVIPRDADGYLKWNYVPPNGYKQYPTMLARFRHTGVAWNKYRKTGKVKYARFVNDNFLDWYKANPYMKKRVSDFRSSQCFDRPESHPNPNYTWFTLHSSIRLKSFTDRSNSSDQRTTNHPADRRQQSLKPLELSHKGI